MEKLVQNITRLIAQHNCVILPGVGAFLAHKVPAYYNAAEKIFMQPHRVLGFNPQVTVDDALLLSEYMNNGKVSYEDAGATLSRDIEKLHSKLSSTGVVRFGELGTFTMDIEGKITFEASEHGIDDPCNYGLEPLAISPLSELKKKDIVIRRGKIGKYVSMAAAVVVLIFMLVPLGNSIYRNDSQLSVAGFTPAENGAKPVHVDAGDEVTAETVCDIAPVEYTATVADDVTLPTGIVVEEAAAQPVEADVVETSREQYSIIVASTPNPENAQLAITELSRKMKADYQVVEGDRRFRIAIESYDCESEANAALERIQGTFSDAWIYIH